jgi:hypothetical protein
MYAAVISQRLFSFHLKKMPVQIESSRSLYSGLKLLELLNPWRRPSFPDTYEKIFIYILGSENILFYIIFATEQKYVWENIM